ncbi:DNA polymerase epsilon subunit B protein [Toxoplasma gondii RUB]|uniref:DNA polymerase II subunit 2 n=1 Tax=Toxoplasma gondii RUB TaxID=935652 RepID=A0A086LL53_TOXGO|nr:DNA polymerase epsilon subunit B protein [Toxoplasma gondii RUB]
MADSSGVPSSLEASLDWGVAGAQGTPFSLEEERSFASPASPEATCSPFSPSPGASYSLRCDLFPWSELSTACRGCAAHLAVLASLRARFPAALLLPSAASPVLLLNFSSLHSLTLCAVGRHPRQRGSAARESLTDDGAPAWRRSSGIFAEERNRGERTRAEAQRGRPVEVLYGWTGDAEESLPADTETEGEDRQGGRRKGVPVRIHWAVVDFVVETVHQSLPRFFSLSRPLPPPEVLMEAALLGWRRRERSRREDEARRKLARCRGKKIFLHSAMTDVHDFSFDTTKQRFQTTPLKPLTLASLGRVFCDSSVFASMFDRRYYVLQQRCLLHPLLSLHGRSASEGRIQAPGFQSDADTNAAVKRVVFEVDGVARRAGQRQLLLAILGRDVNKDLALQGLFSDIRIKFEKEFRPRPGFFLEGHVVLADGFFTKHDDCFHVMDLSHPPRWPSSDRLLFGQRSRRAPLGCKRRRTTPSPTDSFTSFLEEEEGLIAGQQASAMFGGLLALSELTALEEWREIEEEREEDQDEEDLKDVLAVLEPEVSDGAATAGGGSETNEKENRSGGEEGRGRRPQGKRDSGKMEVKIQQDRDSPDPMAWVIVTECHFNEREDVELLGEMLATFESQDEYPSGFVFLGSFSSTISGGEDVYSAGFNALFDLLTSRFPLFVSRCHFVFVPGPDDPSFARESLPRLPLTPPFTSDFQQRIEKAVPASKGKIFFTTSPCRLRHFTSSMVFFRHDVFKALSRDALLTGGRNKETEGQTSVDADIVDLLYNTVVGQAHLCPITADHRLLKHRDQSLGLFPMPDLVFLCDKSAPPVIKKDPRNPDEFIFANANASFRKTKSFFIYEMATHQLTKYFVPSSGVAK